MRRLILFLLIIYLLPVSVQAGSQIPTIEAKGPTVIAFFGPVIKDHLNKDADLNELLSDFQYHLHGAKRRLEETGITVHDLH